MASLEFINYEPRSAKVSENKLSWIKLKRKKIERLPQIIWEDNFTWAEVNLWALDQAVSSKRDLKTEPPRVYRRVIYLSQAAIPDRVKLS